jgi:LytS/YehU family sensor histidine kinase
VNPHFLFNSFNTLISVIEDDKEVAVEYVNKLSDFFRSILSYREKDLIMLSEELALAEDYIFLQQKRYGNAFKVDINISTEIRNTKMVPPLTLQILLENCLKHNTVSIETPLQCDVYIDQDDYLVVRNNMNVRQVKEASTGIGLQNLKNRYRIITGVEISVIEKDGYFTVRMPLIQT